MLRWFPNSKLLLPASHAALPILDSSRLPPVVNGADLFYKLLIKQEIQNSATFKWLITAVTNMTKSLEFFVLRSVV
jgi:hypothetical protein